MNNLVAILCTVISLFHLLGASPVTKRFLKTEEEKALEEVITYLIKLKEHYIKSELQISSEICLVPAYKNEKNATVKDVSCKAFKSLKEVKKCASEIKHMKDLNNSLFNMFPENMTCHIEQHEEEDLLSFILHLLGFFRSQINKLMNN